MAKKAKIEKTAENESQPQRTGGLAEHIRKSIETCGLSHYEIAHRAGIAPQQIYRFMNSGKTLTLETVDKLLPVIDENFTLRVGRKDFVMVKLSRINKETIAYIEQVQDAFEDLKSLLLDGPTPEILDS